MFLAKKIIPALLLPVPIALFFLLLGFIFLLWQRRRWGLWCTGLGIIVLLVFSLRFVPNELLYQLEKTYPPLMVIPTNAHYIVVLGGGVGGDRTRYPANAQLNSASLARLVEGIRLYKQQPESILVLSGGRVFGSPEEATIMNNTAVMLGVPADHIRVLGGSRDTYDEALAVKRVVGDKPFVLVTSAYHMQRSMALFEQQGLHPIAAPTQFLHNRSRYKVKNDLPNSVNLVYTDIALHEYMGLTWAWLLGRVSGL